MDPEGERREPTSTRCSLTSIHANKEMENNNKMTVMHPFHFAPSGGLGSEKERMKPVEGGGLWRPGWEGTGQ